jgi:RNA polymerase sigma factor (sigma-70 family)
MSDATTLEPMEEQVRQLRRQFEQAVLAHRPALWRYCYRLTGSAWDAEDLVQETLVRAFARLAHFWQPLEPRSYLFRVASNAWIDQWRRAGGKAVSLEEAPELAAPASAGLGETWSAMEELVGLLPPRQRVVVLLTQVFDFTAGEAGAMLGMTEGAVKATLHRARATLRAKSGGGEPGEAAGAAPGTAAGAVQGRPPQRLVSLYIEAFNRRDPDALIALLDPAVTAEIVGAGREQGLEYLRKYSLSEWAADPQPMWAEPGELEGRSVIWVFYGTETAEKALAWIVSLETSENRVTAIRTYCFTPDLIRHAAEQLGLPARLLGYMYGSPSP